MFAKKMHHTTGCLVVQIIVTALLFLAMIAALVGVYMAHVLPAGLMFGTSSGSLSLIAFVATTLGLQKQIKVLASKCECTAK